VRRQAVADLQEICEDGLEEIRTGLPDVRLEARQDGLVFATEDASLALVVWDDLGELEGTDDNMAVAGAMVCKNRRGHELLRANIAYEQEDGRFRWNLYSFHAAMLGGNYAYGPIRREHGFERRHFLNRQERRLMQDRATHVWSMGTHGPLTPEMLLVLFAEAMALPNLPHPLQCDRSAGNRWYNCRVPFRS
jgi:hypothetical protein